MAFTINNFEDRQGSPLNEVFPNVTYAVVDFNIAASASRIVQHDTNPGVLPKGTLSNDFIIGSKSIFSFLLATDTAEGGVLEVQLSADGTTFDHWRSYFIHGGGDPEGRGGIEMFGWMARFIVINSSDAVATNFTGMLQLKGF